MKTTYKKQPCVIQKTRYLSTGNTALDILHVSTHELVTRVSVNINEHLKQDEVVIKNFDENKGILPFLIKHGVIAHPHRYASMKHRNLPICKLLI